jgi:glucose-1-phosphate adenylyltransferase
MKDVLTVVLAGGKGSRLEPLTRDRAKPSVPFAGNYRIIDFALSNCLNSDLRRILVLTQYKSLSLDRHLVHGWCPVFCRGTGEFLEIIPPQQRIDENWYRGTADAVYQNIYSIEKARPSYVVILAGDHVYKMNYRKMVESHKESGADLTVGALTVDRKQASQYGVMQVNQNNQVIGFQEKPSNPINIPGRENDCLASMGIYVFNAPFLFDKLCQDATDNHSKHDFGHNIIPSIIDTNKVFAFPFENADCDGQSYWRDVGTLDSFYDANMDLLEEDPALNMYDRTWPVSTLQINEPPAKFVSLANDPDAIAGQAWDSIICSGTIIHGSAVHKSVIGSNVRIMPGTVLKGAIVFERVRIGEFCRIKNAIIDKDVIIPANTSIGLHHSEDRARGFTVSENGIVVVAKGTHIPSENKTYS